MAKIKTDNIVIDVNDKTLRYGNNVIPFKSIESAIPISGCSIQFNHNDHEPSAPMQELLCLTLTEPAAQPGTLFGKTKQVILRCDDEDTSKAVVRALYESQIGVAPESSFFYASTPAFVNKLEEALFDYDAAIVEAKRKMNDYTRAATTGTNAYGRMGIVAPVVDVTCNLTAQIAHVKYIGTTSKLFASEWFSQNKEIDYDYGNCDTRLFYIDIVNGRFQAFAEFDYYAIERDEKASGLWQLRFEKKFSDLEKMAIWFNMLLGKIKSSNNDEPVIAMTKPEVISEYVNNQPEIKKTPKTESLDDYTLGKLDMISELESAGVISSETAEYWKVKITS